MLRDTAETRTRPIVNGHRLVTKLSKGQTTMKTQYPETYSPDWFALAQAVDRVFHEAIPEHVDEELTERIPELSMAETVYGVSS